MAIARLAVDGSMDAQQRIKRRHRPVRAASQADAGVRQRAEGICEAGAFRADPALGPAAVVDDMGRLDRGDDFLAGDPGDIFRPQMLGVFDPEPAVARAVGLGDTFEDVEQQGIGAIAYGMDRNRNPRLVRLADTAFHFPFGEHFLLQQPAIAGGVAVRFKEIRRAPSQRTVGESFQATEAQPGVGGGAEFESRQRLPGAVPVDKGQPGVNPARQFIAAAERVEQFPLAPGRILPIGHILHGRDAVTGRFTQSPAQGLGLLIGRGRGHDGFRQFDGGVL